MRGHGQVFEDLAGRKIRHNVVSALAIPVTMGRLIVVTESEVLDKIKRAAIQGSVVFSSHAELRMRHRGASHRDVLCALETAKAARHQPDNDRWLVEGADCDGDDLDVVVAIEAGVIVVTLF